MWNLINPLEEYMLVWKVKYQGTSCLYEHFQSAWDDWKSFKGEWRLIYPKLVLKGFWHRGMKDFSGW